MAKPDDSSLDPDQLRAVEQRARDLLDRASVWDRYPTPIDDILAAANLRIEARHAFDPADLVSYIAGKTKQAADLLKSALAKVFGIYDANEAIIHIDDTVVRSKQTFLKLHETGITSYPHTARSSASFRTARRRSHPRSPTASSARRTTLPDLRCSRATATPSSLPTPPSPLSRR